MTPADRIYLSPPHLSGAERQFIDDALQSNWIAPLGPHVNEFQREFRELLGVPHALAVSSGTAAIHLSLLVAGVGPGDDVMTGTLTFVGSTNPITYVGATPVFLDSERVSWNLDVDLLASALAERAKAGRLPKAVLVAHLYGQTANFARISELCGQYGVIVIEDAAEALGATIGGRPAGTMGFAGAFSFNGNKIITTAGGGMLVSDNAHVIAHALKLATQARDAAPHYQHSQIGYNYRMSNILAAIGRGQLPVLEERIAARRANFAFYREALGRMPGITFTPEAPWGTHTRWLTTLTIDPAQFGADREDVRLALEARNIEARPIWKPMHQQPIFRHCEVVNTGVSDALFRDGLCLPSGSALTPAQLEKICDVVRSVARQARDRE